MVQYGSLHCLQGKQTIKGYLWGKNSPRRGISCTGKKKLGKRKVEQSLQETSISVELFSNAGGFRMRSAQMDGTAPF